MEGSGGSVLLTPFDCFQIEGTEISPNSFLLRQILDHFRKHDTWEVCQNKFCCQVPDYVYRVVEANTHGWNWKITPGGLKAELSELICAKSRSVESSIMIRWGFKDANSYVKLHEDHWKEKGFEFLQWESFGENVCVGGCNLGADEMSMFGNPSVDEKATSIAEHSEIHMKSTCKNFGFFLGTLILWWAFYGPFLPHLSIRRCMWDLDLVPTRQVSRHQEFWLSLLYAWRLETSHPKSPKITENNWDWLIGWSDLFMEMLSKEVQLRNFRVTEF